MISKVNSLQRGLKVVLGIVLDLEDNSRCNIKIIAGKEQQ